MFTPQAKNAISERIIEFWIEKHHTKKIYTRHDQNQPGTILKYPFHYILSCEISETIRLKSYQAAKVFFDKMIKHIFNPAQNNTVPFVTFVRLHIEHTSYRITIKKMNNKMESHRKSLSAKNWPRAIALIVLRPVRSWHMSHTFDLVSLHMQFFLIHYFFTFKLLNIFLFQKISQRSVQYFFLSRTYIYVFLILLLNCILEFNRIIVNLMNVL